LKCKSKWVWAPLGEIDESTLVLLRRRQFQHASRARKREGTIWPANSWDHSVWHPFLLHYYLHNSNTITLWMMIPI
jgi:hypothetical protein